MKGLRKNKDPEQLLRGLLLHLGCGFSLRETSVRLHESGIAELSDVALLKRLRKSKDWLHALCVSLLKETGRPEKRLRGREYRLFDSSVIKEPGKTGSLWRLHYSLRVPSLRCDFFKVTPTRGAGTGDSFLRYPITKGDLIIADRGYCHAAGIHHVASHGAYVCVRVNQAAIVLNRPEACSFPLLEELETALKHPGTVGEWPVLLSAKDGTSVKGRICAIRKSAMAIRKAQKKLKRRASKKGETLKPETLLFAKYIVLFTTFPERDHSASEILNEYRFRWQVELIFKRLKQVAQLGHLPKNRSGQRGSMALRKTARRNAHPEDD